MRDAVHQVIVPRFATADYTSADTYVCSQFLLPYRQGILSGGIFRALVYTERILAGPGSFGTSGRLMHTRQVIPVN
jgi:hypothetical protein